MQPQLSSDLREFHQFVGNKLIQGVTLSPEEALDQWRALHPDPDEIRDSVAAVQQALADMAAGDVGRPVEEVLEELRSSHNLPSP